MFRHFKMGTRTLIASLVGFAALAMSADAHAQYYYGRRAIVARPIVPVPPPVVYGPTAIHSGPGIFSIQSPFFSFRVDSSLPPVYAYRDYSPYTYPYQRYRFPSVPTTRYLTPAPTYSVPVPIPSEPRYAPGIAGGIPDVTVPEPYAMSRPVVPSHSVGSSSRTLATAARRLYAALSARRDDGDVWLQYLQPDVVAAAADSGRLSPEVLALSQRYEGVTMNPELRWIARLPGFEQTRMMLGQSASSAMTPDSSAMTPDQPSATVPREATKIAPAEIRPTESPAVAPAEIPQSVLTQEAPSGLPSGLPGSTNGGASPNKAPSTDVPTSPNAPAVKSELQAKPPVEIIESLPEPIVEEDI